MLMSDQSETLSHKTLEAAAEATSVSIGAKPMSSFALQRSSAVSIALKRPIRKVSFSDMSDLESSMSGIKSAQKLNAYSPFRNSSASPRSYTLRDAVYNRVPESPACSQHSEVADSDDGKVRGGHLYESDCSSSTASLHSHISRDDLLASCSSAPNQQPPVLSCNSPSESIATASPSGESKLPGGACLSDLKMLNLNSGAARPDAAAAISRPGMQCSGSASMSREVPSSCGHKTHGGNLFGSSSEGKFGCMW